MNPEEFDAIVDAQIRICKDMLTAKAKQYSTYDRLHNFRIASELQGISMQAALGGMLAKHTVSLFDMLQSDEYTEIDRWEETISDHINYLLILRAIIDEAEDKYQETIPYVTTEIAVSRLDLENA